MKPSLSIIIPVYNVEKYLSKCLDSVLVDNAFTGQLVCVNDGSTDGSGKILEEYAKRYPNIEIITQKNAGLSVARNAGFDRATGDYVSFVDSDDWVMPGSIEKIMSQVDGEDVIYFNAKKYDETTHTYDNDCAIKEIKHLDGHAYYAIVYGKTRNMPIACVWGGIYKRSFLKENNLYNEPGIYHEDDYFTPQVLLIAKDVSSINEYVYVYRIREGSITANVTEKHIKDMLYIARNLYAKLQQIENIPHAFYENVKNIYIQLINDGYTNGINIGNIWRHMDTHNLIQCALDDKCRRASKLCYISPYVAYCYMQNVLPHGIQKVINRFL